MSDKVFFCTPDKVYKSPNADKMQVAEIYGVQLWVGLDVTEKTTGLFFYPDPILSDAFQDAFGLAFVDESGKRKTYLNKGRVVAQKLRKMNSMGLFVPMSADVATQWAKLPEGELLALNDAVPEGDIYTTRRLKVKKTSTANASKMLELALPSVREFEGFAMHGETNQIHQNLTTIMSMLNAGFTLRPSVKVHGTSFRVAKVKVPLKVGKLDTAIAKALVNTNRFMNKFIVDLFHTCLMWDATHWRKTQLGQLIGSMMDKHDYVYAWDKETNQLKVNPDLPRDVLKPITQFKKKLKLRWLNDVGVRYYRHCANQLEGCLTETAEPVIGTRTVVLDDNSSEGYHSNDFRKRSSWVVNRLNEGEAVYGEVVGYENIDKPIMLPYKGKPYDYGLLNGEFGVLAYRMTFNGEDLPLDEMIQRCDELGIQTVHYLDKSRSLTDIPTVEALKQYVTDMLDASLAMNVFTHKDENGVLNQLRYSHTNEGLILRLDSPPNSPRQTKAFKLKGAEFCVEEGILFKWADDQEIEVSIEQE